MNRTITRWGASAAISAAMLVGLAGAGQAQQTNWLKKFKDPNKESITLKGQGYFYVNGRYFTDEGDPNTVGGMRMTGQQYVEFQIPKHVKHRYPIVMIHGGSQTAANWMGTLDGREGWRSFFTANGYVVYLVDQVGRGRSPAYNPLPPAPEVYGTPFGRPANVLSRERTWTIPEQYMDYANAAMHTQWPSFGQPGAGKPGDPYFDQFFASQIQSRNDPSGMDTQRDAQNAGAALLDKIGPAIVITHSQSAAQGFLITDARPNLVKALVTLETGGGRATGPTTTGWVITAAPITYSPPVTNPATQLSFAEEPTADGPNLIKCWLQTAPARQLPNLQRTNHLLIVAEASAASHTFHCVSKYLRQAGVEHTFANLGQVGIHGNAHMIMVEKNALQTAAFVASWLEDKLEKKRGRHNDDD